MSGGSLRRPRRGRSTGRSFLRSCPPPAGAGEPTDLPAADRARVLGGLSDDALLAAMGGAGSKAALWELFQRHGAAVHRLGCLFVSSSEEVDRLVENVFVTLARRSGQLEDDVENVRLGLLAMAWRRIRPNTDGVPCSPLAPAGGARSPTDAAAIARLRGLASGDRGALALTVLAAASLTDVAIVLEADRRAVGARLCAGLRTLDARREPAAP